MRMELGGGGQLPVQCACVSGAFFPTSILKGQEHERQPQCLSKVKSWIISEVKLQTRKEGLKHQFSTCGVMIPGGSESRSHSYFTIHNSRKATVRK